MDYLEPAILVVNLFEVVAVEDRPLAHEGVELREDGGLVDELGSHLSPGLFRKFRKELLCWADLVVELEPATSQLRQGCALLSDGEGYDDIRHVLPGNHPIDTTTVTVTCAIGKSA